MIYTIGLTGGIGSGKTLVSDRLAEHGVPIIDTDVVAREIVLPGAPALDKLVHRFGGSILLENGALNRDALRRIAFSSPNNKHALDNITHPAIRQMTIDQVAAAEHDYCAIVIPLLTKESVFGQFLQRVLAVNCDQEIRIQRVMKRNSLTREEVLNILNTQISDAEREAFADDIIFNNGSKEKALRQTDTLHEHYLTLSKVARKEN